MKKDYDSTKIYRKTQKKGASQTYDTPSVKEFNEVREVKAICFTAKSSTKKAVGFNF